MRNQAKENAEVKDKNQFLESKGKILTRDENEKEKDELTDLDRDFNVSDAGEGKTDREQGLVPPLQLSDQSPLVKIAAVDFKISKKKCMLLKELSVKVKKKVRIINAIQTFNVNEIKQRIPTFPPPPNSVEHCLENIENQVRVNANTFVSSLKGLKNGYGKLIESSTGKLKGLWKEKCDLNC